MKKYLKKIKKKGRFKKTRYDDVEWEQPKCIKHRVERVYIRQSIYKWGGEGKKSRNTSFRQELNLGGLHINLNWELKGCF